jgi:hypothetical protein
MGTEACSFDGELLLIAGANDTVEFTRALGQELSPCWGASENGLELTRYSVPEDLPRGKPLKAVIEVRRPARASRQKYGAARLVVVKTSDK